MIASMLVLIIGLSQSGRIEANDPTAGYSTDIRFTTPTVVTTGEGSSLVFEGASFRTVPGEPLRPVVTLMVPVPPGSDPVLDFTVSDLLPTGLSGEQTRVPIVSGEGLARTEIPADPRSPPSSHAELIGVFPLAGCTFAVVSVYPVAGPDASAYAKGVRIDLSWEPSTGGVPVEGTGLPSFLAPRGTLCWPRRAGPAAASPFWGSPWARLSVEETGGYRLTGSALENAGCEVVGSPAASLRLYTGPGEMFADAPETEHALTEVACMVDDQDGDGIFDPEDRVSFIGRGLDRWSLTDQQSGLERLEHRYSSHNVYWLTWGGGNGTRIQEISGVPDGSPGWGDDIRGDLWLREQDTWWPEYETSTGWIWESAQPGEKVTVGFQLEDSGVTGTLRVGLAMDNSSGHTVDLRLNGTQVYSDTWYGSGPRMLEVPDLSFSTSNTLEIEYSQGTEGSMGLVYVWVEHPADLGDATGLPLFPALQRMGRFVFQIPGTTSAASVFDLTDFCEPRELIGTGHSGDVLSFALEVDSSSVLMVLDGDEWMSPDSIAPAGPGRLVGTVSRGDRLLVVDASMLDGIWSLTALASGMGNEPVVATTRELFDEFGQGVADPGAIRSGVRWAMDSWDPGLDGLILVGDGHYDPRGFSTLEPVLVPVWLELGTSRQGAVDDVYIMVHEGADLPEIPVSRLPAGNLSELGTLTAKILGYASGGTDGTWRNRSLVVADDEWGQGNSWNETEHTRNCELIAEEALPRWVDREKFYLIEYPWPSTPVPGGPHLTKPVAREDFIAEFSEGFGTVLYIGHGAYDQIAHEKLFLSSDIDRLSNGPRLPVSFWATCDVGRFDNPGTDAISESLILHPAGGCISSVAGTCGTFGPSNYLFARGVIDSLYTNPDLSVGESVWLSKLEQSGSYTYNNKYYLQLGFLDLPLFTPDSTGSVTVNGDTLRSGELNSLTGSSFGASGLAFVEVLESSIETVYGCLGGAEIQWLRYGGTAYRGTQDVIGGAFQLDCFVPMQSTTGDLARAGAVALGVTGTACGAEDPVVLVVGEPSGGDLQGPEVEMWISGYEGVEHPEVTGEVTLEAKLSDSSGICILGGSGKQLTLFLDGLGTDVGPWFIYRRGSATSGTLTYSLGNPTAGEHELILWSLDGLGNSSIDTLAFTSLENVDLSITEMLVYPNPGDGIRSFSFRVTEDSRVTVSIFTVAGSMIEQIEAICGQGYNQILWDGLDRDGDPPASGSYIYRIEAVASGYSVFDRTAEETGILAVVREQGGGR